MITEIGSDADGVTEISLDALKQYVKSKKLKSIAISKNGKSAFVFKDDTFYIASGFSFGYGGEGPHGLHKAIRLWFPKAIDEDFWNTEIPHLDQSSNWTWAPKGGFIRY